MVDIPIYPLEPDAVTGNKDFRVYNFDGKFPGFSDLLVPHRKDHYLIVFVRRAQTRQWIDTTPYFLKDNTIYFSAPDNIIIKEEFKQLWSTGIAFTPRCFSFQENLALSKLPIIENPQGVHELSLIKSDCAFVEEMLSRINLEYISEGQWQQRMLTAYLMVLLTYLSRLYTEQYPEQSFSSDRSLLRKYYEMIDEHFRQKREVNEYASLLNISAGHLSEVIKVESGKPAKKHIHARMTLEARRLLLHTENSLKEISYNLGFNDFSYFNRFFKRETGVTPAEYRSTIRKMYH